MLPALLALAPPIYAPPRPYTLEPVKTRTRNADLPLQLEGDPARVLPQGETYSLALDTHLFFRKARDFPGYYHGAFWLAPLVEYRPRQDVAVNTRLVVSSGSTSYGYVNDVAFTPFFSISWSNPERIGQGVGLQTRFRLFDLDRQTLGAGLLFQEKEMNGILLEFRLGQLRMRNIWNGTGALYIAGDLHWTELDYADKLIGLTLGVTAGVENTGVVGLFSTHEIGGGLGYGLEGMLRGGRFAGLAELDHHAAFGPLRTLLRVEARRYSPRFAPDAAGAIEHDYLSIEQEDKPYVDAFNVLAVDDGVYVYALRGDLDLELSRWLTVFAQNEVGRYDYELEGASQFYVYRGGAAFTLWPDRNGAVEVFFSNRSTSALAGPYYRDIANREYFETFPFIGIEGRFRF